jgi:hypothetical protein
VRRLGVSDPKLRRIVWRPCCRLVPSLYTSRGPFDRVVDPADNDHLTEAEAATNPRGSRFSDGTLGVDYAGRTLSTAIRETKHQ